MTHFASYIVSFLPTYESLGLWGYSIVFGISLVESLAFVGAFIPGGLAIILIGFAAANGVLNLGSLIFWSAFGAIVGDSISFYLGTKGVRFFHDENKLLRISHIERGREFFKAHGNKSVFLGRFIGPIRAIVPFIAGLSHMKKSQFFFWNITSGFVWATSFLLLGYFFGNFARTLEVWITRSGIFIVVLGVLSFIIWMLIKKSRPVIEFVRAVGFSLRRVILFSPRVKKLAIMHPGLISFIRRRFQNDAFTGLPLTIIAVVFALILLTFGGLTAEVVRSMPVALTDKLLAQFLLSFRDPALTKIFFWITQLGNPKSVFLIAIFSCAAFLARKKADYILPFIFTIAGTELTVFALKLLIQRDRPAALFSFYAERGFAFPSGHAAIAVALFGFLVYFLIGESGGWRRRTNIFSVGFFVVLFVGFSRLYLGVHYLSDVLGGFVVGLLWLIVGIILTEIAKTRNGILS